MKIYRLRVSIMGLTGVYRLIDISENCTFDDLHDIIFKAFDRYEAHLYSFFLTGKDTTNIRRIYKSPEITHPMNLEDDMGWEGPRQSTSKTRIGDIDFEAKDVFHYLFDFGDDWWHRIRVDAVTEASGKKKHIEIVKTVGQSPPQYDDDDDDDEDDEDYDD